MTTGTHAPALSGADVIVLDGVLDDAAARRLEEALAELRPGAEVRLDLTRVREIEAQGLARLARSLSRGASRVALLGLGRHHRRLLRYLGVDAGGHERGALAVD